MKTDTWTVEGGVPLRGEVHLSGAKNSITKLMVASMLTTEPCIFHNAPSIGDSQITRAICEALGAEFEITRFAEVCKPQKKPRRLGAQ